jgi:hypothetical protein
VLLEELELLLGLALALEQPADGTQAILDVVHEERTIGKRRRPMRPLLLLTLTPILTMTSLTALAARPVYAVREYPEVVISGINAQTKAIGFSTPGGGFQDVRVGPKTWIIKDNDEATFEDLRVGQRVHVWFMARAAQAVVVEVLPATRKEAEKRSADGTALGDTQRR